MALGAAGGGQRAYWKEIVKTELRVRRVIIEILFVIFTRYIKKTLVFKKYNGYTFISKANSKLIQS